MPPADATPELLLLRRTEGGRELSMLAWVPGEPFRVASTAMVGGGVGERAWWINAEVPIDYDRIDVDVHVAELVADVGLGGDGVGMLTGVDVTEVRQAEEQGVVVWATVGLGTPTWAAAPDEGPIRWLGPGTVNLLVVLPEALTDAALINAVATATEAKVQALGELGVPGTGTASDAVCVACPLAQPGQGLEPFGGPRSIWGARLARAVHAAVQAGAEADPRWRTRRTTT